MSVLVAAIKMVMVNIFFNLWINAFVKTIAVLKAGAHFV